MISFFSIQLLLACICLTTASINLKVGLYNSIPDLRGDKLASYKSMVEKGFNNDDHTVNAVVNEDDYSPYGPIQDYLNGDFDLIEIDTADLLSILDLIIDINEVLPMPTDTLPTARSALQVGNKLFGYPTLVCGNFIIGLSPSTECSCPLRKSRSDFKTFESSIKKCTKNWMSIFSTYERIIGGKMNDAYGWYLPYLYFDAYIDINGPGSIDRAVQDLNDGIVDSNVCTKLRWFINLCGKCPDSNKCYHKDVNGSYVQDKDNVIKDIINEETMFSFGFSEIAAKAIHDANVCPYSITSWPLGPSNYIVQFTDALVVNKNAWETASEEKQNAIRDFIKYYTGYDLRRKIALGEDLSPPKNRYLLQAIESFYKSLDDPIYQDLYWHLQRSVAAPSLSSEDRKLMEDVLEEKCIGSRKNKKIKSEL